MTIHVNRQDAENKFAELFSQVLEGEEVIISVGGKEMAKLVPFADYQKIPQTSAVRIPGIDEGRFVVPDNFDEPLPADILKSFERGE